MKHLLHFVLAAALLASCQEPSAQQKNAKTAGAAATTTTKKASGNFKEGQDYQVYERVRLIDREGFDRPAEAYSILLPKGWNHEDAIIWNAAGTRCAGTTQRLKATSGDGRYELELMPSIVFTWGPGSQSQGNGSATDCQVSRPPIEAEAYLREVFAPQIGNPKVLEVTANPYVVEEMARSNASTIREMQGYGAGAIRFNQTAINARVQWADGKEGMISLGSSIMEGEVPNVYNGTSETIYTTMITKRTIFKYPAKESAAAQQQFSVMMASIRTNPAWSEAVNGYWRNIRQQSNVAHQGRIHMTDAMTKQMGEQAIARGNQRLKDMDSEMRTWEAKQSSQDRMHTEFIKTIRGVENFQDPNGKYEMTAGYEHAWSRGDGSSFILSNNPNFDPSSVFQDQNWKQMKKVQ